MADVQELVTANPIVGSDIGVWGQKTNDIHDLVKGKVNELVAASNAVKKVAGDNAALLAAIVETIQDTVAAMFVGNGITFSYNDTTGQITATVNVGTATPALTNTTAPIISGTVFSGNTLTAGNGAWSATPDKYAYQWRRNGAAISGATAATYILVAADVGTDVTVTVTASKAGFSDAYAPSAAVRPSASSTITSGYLLTDDNNYLTTEAGNRFTIA